MNILKLVKTGAIMLGAAVFSYFPGLPVAAAYPDKAITIVVPFPPGGGTDIMGRYLADAMSKSLNVPVVVENRAGASGTIGTASVVSSAADGYTILMGAAPNITLAPSMYKSLSYDPLKDLKPVALVMQAPLLLVAPKEASFSSVQELIAYGKSNPNKLNFGGGSPGSSQHLAAANFTHSAGLDAQFIPYAGTTPVLNDLIAGRLDYAVSESLAMSFVNAGRLKLLATAGSERSSLLPDVPTIMESGLKDVAVVNWNGLFFPAGVDDSIVNKINELVIKIIGAPESREKFSKSFHVDTPPFLTAPEFTKLISDDIRKWAGLSKVLKLSAN